MMDVRFRARASADLQAIRGWIAKDSPATAARVVDRILSGVERLAQFPQMGRKGKVEGTRHWPIPRLPYIVVYEIDEALNRLTVLAIFHSAQDR
jgi:toxin ParE1/3/4